MNAVIRGYESNAPSSVSLLGQTGIIIPTYNAARFWPRLHAALERQGITRDQVLFVDSSSEDRTRDLVRAAGYGLKIISKESFRHGETRQMAIKHLPGANLLVFMTQDAVPLGENAVETLLRPFECAEVGAVYGRQVAREQAGPLERHARLFNYPDQTEMRDYQSRKRLGFKTAFFSNSFGAYRRTALEQVGGFPNVILAEDSLVAARMLLEGWKITYEADAIAVHSHAFTLAQEFARYFDTGVYHARERWVVDQFGSVGGEGLNFVRSEFRYLRQIQPGLIPLAFLRNVSKWLSYQLGVHERMLPHRLKQAISGQPNFWRDEEVRMQGSASRVISPMS